MCGITGWVDFERDLTGERETLDAMTKTMACRGPDASGVFLAPHAGLGHRRLAVIDIEGGRQPMTVAEGTTVAAMTYSGEAYNFRELRAELAAAGHGFSTESDTEVVLRAYLEWGDAFVDRLNGMFALAIWDTRREELLLVRDRLGIKPLFYAPTPHGVLFGSEPKAILAHPSFDGVVNLDGFREMLAIVKTPEQSVYSGMYEVRPGQVVTVGRSGVSRRRYWQLEAIPHTDDLPTTVATVRELLLDIVSRQLISDVPLCTLLSGGLDSSTVTALAAAALAREGRGAVRSFSVDFAGYIENFVADVVRPTPDTPFAHDLARHVGADHRDIVLSTADLIDPEVLRDVVTAFDYPVNWGDGYTSLLLLFKAIREQSTVALSGESADEVFGGYAWFFHEESINADVFPWLTGPKVRMAEATLLDPGLRGKLDLAEYRRASYRDALAEVPHLPDGPVALGRERRMRELCYVHLTRFVCWLLDRKDRTSMATGLEVRVPFCDHRLVQYVFNTPWAMKTFDGREKSLLRAAAGDFLPESVRDRKKVPYPATQDPTYDAAVREALGKLLVEDSPALPLIDRARCEAAAAGTDDEVHRTDIEFVLQLDTWLRDYQITLDLSA
ncbi:MAG TPA: asparagine synthase (glutamine-hydrolyzing) [Acidimicrobiia bacterium]|nr:asparagine synthase (glutamine-hydrolyzing) [Acidimicrobiia bacterium]